MMGPGPPDLYCHSLCDLIFKEGVNLFVETYSRASYTSFCLGRAISIPYVETLAQFTFILEQSFPSQTEKSATESSSALHD